MYARVTGGNCKHTNFYMTFTWRHSGIRAVSMLCWVAPACTSPLLPAQHIQEISRSREAKQPSLLQHLTTLPCEGFQRLRIPRYLNTLLRELDAAALSFAARY